MNSKLINYYLFLLGKRDYSIFNLRKKASEKGYETKDINEAIAYLQHHQLVDDKRYGENLVLKYKQGRGRYWIENKLKTVGLEKKIIAEVLSGFSNSSEDLNKVKQKLERKYKIEDWKNIEPKTKQKILGWLGRNGFSGGYELLNKFGKNNLDDEYES